VLEGQKDGGIFDYFSGVVIAEPADSPWGEGEETAFFTKRNWPKKSLYLVDK